MITTMRLLPEECRALQSALNYLTKQEQISVEKLYEVNLNRVFNKLSVIIDENEST